jgi:hypothetical protein
MPGRDQPIDTRRLTVDLKTVEGAPGCTFAAGSPGFPLASGPDRYASAVPMCLIHTGRVGEWSESTVTNQGVVRRSSLRLSNRVCHTGSTPIRPCAGAFTEWYSLVVPKPTGGDSGGVVLLRFDYSLPHAGPDALSASSFYVHRDTFGVLPGGQVTLPSGDTVGLTTTQPLLDTFATTVRPEADAQGQSVLLAQWVADRPVTVTAAVEDNDPDTCSRDPKPTATSVEPATSGTLRLDGLCAGTRSSVGLTLRAATGETASYTDVEGLHADRVGPGFTATTHGTPLTISPAVLFANVAGQPPGSVIRTLRMVVRANGQSIINAQMSYDLHQGIVTPRLDQFPCSSLAAFRFTPASHLSPEYPIPASPRPMLWPEDVYITVSADINIGTDPCAQPNGHPPSYRSTDFHEYGFPVTTAGPDSILLTPSGTHGPPPLPREPSVTWTADGDGLILQLNAHAG